MAEILGEGARIMPVGNVRLCLCRYRNGENVSPPPHDPVGLGEKPVSSDIDPVPLILHRAGDSADIQRILFDDNRVYIRTREEFERRRESRRPRTDNDRSLRHREVSIPREIACFISWGIPRRCNLISKTCRRKVWLLDSMPCQNPHHIVQGTSLSASSFSLPLSAQARIGTVSSVRTLLRTMPAAKRRLNLSSMTRLRIGNSRVCIAAMMGSKRKRKPTSTGSTDYSAARNSRTIFCTLALPDSTNSWGTGPRCMSTSFVRLRRTLRKRDSRGTTSAPSSRDSAHSMTPALRTPMRPPFNRM